MTDIEKLEILADGCNIMTYFLAGFATCILLKVDHPVVGFMACVIGFALI